MKKKNKVIRKDYNKIENKYRYNFYSKREYYGLLIKNTKVRIDVKRYKKFFILPEGINANRDTIYFIPFKRKREDYNVNYFLDGLDRAEEIWKEQSEMIDQMIKNFIEIETSKRPKSHMEEMIMGYISPSEMHSANSIELVLHDIRTKDRINNKINKLKKTLYSQTIHEIATHLEHAMVLTLIKNGYEGKRAGRNDVIAFINFKMGISEEKLKELIHWDDWRKFYSIWNFIKHCSPSTYKTLHKDFSNLLVDLNFPSDNFIAIDYLKIDDDFINQIFKSLREFYSEFCYLCYKEPIGFSKWNYDDYFKYEVAERMKNDYEEINNPLGLPPWI